MGIAKHNLRIGDVIKADFTRKKFVEGRQVVKGEVVQITPYIIVVKPHDAFYPEERVSINQADVLCGETRINRLS